MNLESLQNFDLVRKEVKLKPPHVRKKKPSQKSPRTLLNMIWNMIKHRCYNPKNEAYERYFGRGITMCDRWRFGEDGKSGFECFMEDMGPRPSMFHSVERNDNDGNYCPENCYWGTPPEQTRNKRSNNWVTYKGETMILTDLATKYGMNYGTLYSRVFRHGWSIEDAMEKELKHQWLIFYEGNLYSHRGLCKHLGVGFSRTLWYVNSGKTMKEAFEICLSKPPMGSR